VNACRPAKYLLPATLARESTTLRGYSSKTIFVVYCAGPHCNGAHRGAIRLAKLGRPVKLMIGGIAGWLDEGFELASSAFGCAAPLQTVNTT
jgi:rhodanese-related sulfurtransferase